MKKVIIIFNDIHVQWGE